MNPRLKLTATEQQAFAKGVYDARRKAGMTQAALAPKIGIGVQALSHIERGSNLPSLPVYFALCRALGFKKLPLLD